MTEPTKQLSNPILDFAGIDQRIKDSFGRFPPIPVFDVESRDVLVAIANSEKTRAKREKFKPFLDANNSADVAAFEGLSCESLEYVSEPDGNCCKIHLIRPDSDETLPCVYYIHGGGMQYLSCYDGNYQAWGRIMAAQGIAVAMVEFRNAVVPSAVDAIAPFPAGLNDCLSGLKWVVSHAAELGIDPDSILLSGESGGANLAIASVLQLKREGNLALVNGLYVLCPYIAGTWPQDRYPSSSKYNGVLIDLHSNQGRVGYGVEAFEAKNPLAWPDFASDEDLMGFPPTRISLNEFDPLLDEGREYAKRLSKLGVDASYRIVEGSIHGTEVFPMICPDISQGTAEDIARFIRGES